MWRFRADALRALFPAGALDVIVYGSGFDDQDKDDLSYHGLIMIDNLIGEYNCVTQVRHFDFQELPDEQDKEDLLPLSQLASFIEARKRDDEQTASGNGAMT